jgi:hypothetical protein
MALITISILDGDLGLSSGLVHSFTEDANLNQCSDYWQELRDLQNLLLNIPSISTDKLQLQSVSHDVTAIIIVIEECTTLLLQRD